MAWAATRDMRSLAVMVLEAEWGMATTLGSRTSSRETPSGGSVA